MMLRTFKKFGRKARHLVLALTSVSPFLIIGSLLYAVFFIKAAVPAHSVEPEAIERRDMFYSLAAPTLQTVWAAGSSGKVVKSDDGGRTWQRQPTPTDNSLQGMAAWDDQHAVAVGNKGTIITTADGGQSWQPSAPAPSDNPNKLFRVRIFDGTAWAVGEFHTLLRSQDRGATWSRMLPEKDSALNNICMRGQQGWLVGEFGSILRTSDGGTHWAEVAAVGKNSLMAVAFRDASNGVAVGLSGTVLRSSDGGASWTAAAPVTKEHLYSVIWDGSRWMAVGDKGMMVSAEADAAHWTAARISSKDLAWHTQIEQSGPRYYLAGAHLAVLQDQQLTVAGQQAH